MRKFIGLMTLAALGLTFGGLAAAEGEVAAPKDIVNVVAHAEQGSYQFIGVDGCKLCHKTEKSGDQYGKWMASSHAKAAAVKAGVEGNPQEAAACLSCHVTGHGAKAEMFDAKFKKEDGVGCESCHGAGSGYKAKKTMEDRALSMAGGLVMPSEALCRTCHNEKSPTFKEFNYEEAVKKIAHPTPEGE